MRSSKYYIALVAVSIACLLFSCGRRADEISYTTQSSEARQYLLAGLELDDAFQYEEAGVLYQKAIEADPEFAMAYYYWSNVAYTTEEYVERINKAIELSPKISEPERLIILRGKAIFEEDIYLARKYSEKLVKLLPNGKRAHYLHGNFYYSRQEWDSAKKEYCRTIELDPTFALAYNQLAYVYSNLADYPEAIIALKKYSELRPKDPNPYDSMGEIYLWMGDHENSIKSFSQALSLDQDFISSIEGLGHNYTFMGEYDKARAEYDRLLVHASSVADTNSAYYWLALSCLYQGKHSDAIRAFNDRLDFARAHKDIYTEARTRGFLGAIYIEKSDYAKALNEVKMIRELVMDIQFQSYLRDQYLRDCIYTETLVLAYQRKFEQTQGKLDEYEKSARVSKNPVTIMTFYELKGLVAFLKNDYEAAIEDLKQADTQSQYAKYYLGQSYALLGNQQEANKIFAEIAGYNRNDLYYAFVRPKVISEQLSLIAENAD